MLLPTSCNNDDKKEKRGEGGTRTSCSSRILMPHGSEWLHDVDYCVLHTIKKLSSKLQVDSSVLRRQRDRLPKKQYSSQAKLLLVSAIGQDNHKKHNNRDGCSISISSVAAEHSGNLRR